MATLTDRLELLITHQVPEPALPVQDNPLVDLLKEIIARIEALEARPVPPG